MRLSTANPATRERAKTLAGVIAFSEKKIQMKSTSRK